MKASKFSEAQIALVVKQGEEGAQIAEVCRNAGISDAIFYNWRKMRRSDALRDKAIAPVRGGERQAEADLKLVARVGTPKGADLAALRRYLSALRLISLGPPVAEPIG